MCIRDSASVIRLNLINCVRLPSLVGLGALPALAVLDVSWCCALTTLSPLFDLSRPALTKLDLSHCTSLRIARGAIPEGVRVHDFQVPWVQRERVKPALLRPLPVCYSNRPAAHCKHATHYMFFRSSYSLSTWYLAMACSARVRRAVSVATPTMMSTEVPAKPRRDVRCVTLSTSAGIADVADTAPRTWCRALTSLSPLFDVPRPALKLDLSDCTSLRIARSSVTAGVRALGRGMQWVDRDSNWNAAGAPSTIKCTPASWSRR